jgi:hypothetical protein
VAAAVVALLPSWRGGTPATGPAPARPALPVGPDRAGPPPHPAADATMLMPRIGVNAPADSTTLLPRIVNTAMPDQTVMLPLVPRVDDATSLLPAVMGQPDETGLIRLPRYRPPPPDEVLIGEAPDRDVPPAPKSGWRRLLIEAGLIAAILGIWLFSVSRTSTANVGEFGLLSVLNPAYYIAITLCVVRFVRELAREHWRGWLLVTHTVLLVILIQATVPLLIRYPEYYWTYRHIGVVNDFLRYGAITDPTDIYQLWPTFFAMTAHLIAASGVSALSIATWAPVFFDLAYSLPLFAIVRTLSKDRRLPYLTVFVFQAVNWVAQDYFAPQAFTYTLCLGVLLIMLRWLRRTARPGLDRTPRLLARLWAWVGNGLAEVPYTSKVAQRGAMIVLYVVFGAVVASHQLSPYLIAMIAIALAALGLIRPLRIVAGLVVITVAYLIPRYSVVDHYGLFSGFNFFSNAQTTSPMGGAASPGRLISGEVAQFMSLTVWGLAALAVVASRRRLGPLATPAVLAFAPFGLLLAQSYGGEAIYRVYFFSVPWCAYLVAALILQRQWLPRGVAIPGAVLVLLAAIGGNLQGRHGTLSFNQYTDDELAASEFIYQHAEPHSGVYLAGCGFPNRFTVNSGTFVTDGILDGADNKLAQLQLTEVDLPTINSTFGEDRDNYLVFSPKMAKCLVYFGRTPKGLMERLQSTISNSPNWQLYYRNRDVSIYKYFP